MLALSRYLRVLGDAAAVVRNRCAAVLHGGAAGEGRLQHVGFRRDHTHGLRAGRLLLTSNSPASHFPGFLFRRILISLNYCSSNFPFIEFFGYRLSSNITRPIYAYVYKNNLTKQKSDDLATNKIIN